MRRMHDCHLDPCISYTPALIARPVIMPPVPVIAVVIVFISENKCGILNLVRNGELPTYITDDAIEIGSCSDTGQIDQPVIQSVGIRSLWINIQLPGFPMPSGLNTSPRMNRGLISRVKQYTVIGCAAGGDVWLIDPAKR